MGSATVAHLARRGIRVLGLEQYDIPHERGSSHGLSRIIRLAYFEHPAYVPLLHRAYELWWALERDVQERLLIITGSLDIGTVDSTVFGGALKAAQLHHLVHEVLEPEALHRRFPATACKLSSWVSISPRVACSPRNVVLWPTSIPLCATAPTSMAGKGCTTGTAGETAS